MGEFNVNKNDGSLEQTAGMPSEYPADNVMMSDGVTSVEDAVDDINNEFDGLSAQLNSNPQNFTAENQNTFVTPQILAVYDAVNSGGWSTLIVSGRTSAHLNQIIINSTFIAVRGYESGVWSAWVKKTL